MDTMKWTFAHYNGIDSDFAESGPYTHGWYPSEDAAKAAMLEWREKNPASDGWRARVIVMSEEEYRRS